jgi:tRNA (cmo5U34)-methyltransferase
MNRDQIYLLPRERVGDFTFDDAVAEVFPDMIARSVPGYASILSMIEQLAARFVQPRTNIYDLGCSLGAASLLVRQQAPLSCTIHAIDNAPAMVQRLQQRIFEIAAVETKAGKEFCDVEVHEADMRDFCMSNASLVVLNLTLQFIPASERQAVLQAIFDALVPQGALLVSEKICFSDPAQQSLLNELHHDFKRAHGYSDLEIAQKRTSLEKRMIPETLDAHLSRLKSVGFQIVAPWFQCFNFVSILAVKSDSALLEPDAEIDCDSDARN